MITTSIILGVVAVMVLSFSYLKMRAQRNFLDTAACVEQDRARIALQVLYEAHTKHNLSFDETVEIIESIRLAPNSMARREIADRIVNQHKAKKIGF